MVRQVVDDTHGYSRDHGHHSMDWLSSPVSKESEINIKTKWRPIHCCLETVPRTI